MTSSMKKWGLNTCDDAGVRVFFGPLISAITAGFFLPAGTEGALAFAFFVFFLGSAAFLANSSAAFLASAAVSAVNHCHVCQSPCVHTPHGLTSTSLLELSDVNSSRETAEKAR